MLYQPPNDLHGSAKHGCWEIKNLMQPCRPLFHQAQRFKQGTESQWAAISFQTNIIPTNQRYCCQRDFQTQSQLDGCLRSGDAKLEGGVYKFRQVSREKLKSRSFVEEKKSLKVRKV